MDMTQEQLDLMWEHFKLDNPEKFKRRSGAHDPEYDENGKELEDMPDIPEGGYYDPDFEDEWEKLGQEEPTEGEISDRNFVGENPSEGEGKDQIIPQEPDLETNDTTQWEEVE